MRTDGDYISREEALSLIDFYWQQAYNAHFLDAAVRLVSVYREMEDIPAADVCPVVLCRECKYSHPLMNNCKKCSYWSAHGLVVADHDFCSHGERREES